MKIILFCLMGIIFLHSTAFGWGRPGHKTICGIAYKLFDDETRSAVNKLIGGEQEFIESCVWADDVRDHREINANETNGANSEPKNKDYHPDTYEYHYINIWEPEKGFNPKVDCEADDCVSSAIKRYGVYLRRYHTKLKTNPEATPREIQKAQESLKFLAHFVGDLHQPLHVGLASDLGGNTIEINWQGQKRKLHSFWDTSLPLEAKIDPTNIDRLTNLITQNNGQPNWQNAKIYDWVRESWELSKSKVYLDTDGNIIKTGDDIKAEYVERAKPIVEERILKASVRLAFLLSEATKGKLKFED